MTGRVVVPYDLLVGGLLMRPAYRRLAGTVAREVPPGGAVLDVGTGPARLLRAMAALRPDLVLTGIDPSADMLARARRQTAGVPGFRLVEAFAEDLPVGDASQDAVVSSLSSHHWADAAAAIAEQARVLTPGGRWWLLDLRRELSEQLPERIRQAGLDCVAVDPRLGWYYGRRFGLLTARKAAG